MRKKAIFYFLIFSLAVGLSIQSCATSGTTALVDVNITDIRSIVGEWKRADDGYLLNIKESGGKVDVTYYNPRLGYIYVSQSKISTKNKEVRVELTLNDRIYTDCKYDLAYIEKTNALYGKYTHPGGTMPVNFYRVEK